MNIYENEIINFIIKETSSWLYILNNYYLHDKKGNHISDMTREINWNGGHRKVKGQILVLLLTKEAKALKV